MCPNSLESRPTLPANISYYVDTAFARAESRVHWARTIPARLSEKDASDKTTRRYKWCGASRQNANMKEWIHIIVSLSQLDNRSWHQLWTFETFRRVATAEYRDCCRRKGSAQSKRHGCILRNVSVSSSKIHDIPCVASAHPRILGEALQNNT